MPSYADEYAALHPELQGTNAVPVRLTISRGDVVCDSAGRYSYAEKWEEEEIMDVELVSSVDEEATKAKDKRQDPEDRLVDTVRERLAEGRQRGARFVNCSLLVLDTNTLLSALPILMTLFSQCLSRNVFALSNSTFPPSPLALIVPHTVLSELDNLKTSMKRNVGPLARAANNWILSALQMQKKQMYDNVQRETPTRERIPESSWVLHVENTAHANALGTTDGPLSSLTPDEEIVRLCVSLQRDAGFDTFFCSDDTNARTRAEIEGLPTFSFAEIASGSTSGESKEEMVKVATDLIEQWQAQIHGPGEELGRMGGDDHMLVDSRQPVSSGHGSQSRTIQHSIHASSTTKTKSHQKPKTSPTARTSSPPTKSHSKSADGMHKYPNDRSTSSSMWAVSQR